MKTLSAAWLLTVKDLRLYFRDPTGMLLGFLLPIALITVFGFIMRYAFGGDSGVPRVALWVADEDRTRESLKFVDELRSSDMLSVQPSADDGPVGADHVRRLVQDGEAHHALVIQQGFSKAIEAGERPQLTMIRDPGRKMEGQIIRSVMAQALLVSSEGRGWKSSMTEMMRKAGMDEGQLDQLGFAIEEMQDSIRKFIEAEEAANNDKETPSEKLPDQEDEDDLTGFNFFNQLAPVENEDVVPPGRPKMLTYQLAQSVSGVSVMMLMFGLLGCSSMLLYERESGMLRRLFVMAISRESVLVGKFLFCVLVGIAQMLVLFVYGSLLSKINAFRDPITLALLSISWVVAATSFGMVIAAWAKTAKQAEGLATILILVMAALGGCWFPVQLMDLPVAGRIATQAMPTYWAMQGYQAMFWDQLSFTHSRVLTAMAVQWAFAAVFSTVAIVMFRRRYIGR